MTFERKLSGVLYP